MSGTTRGGRRGGGKGKALGALLVLGALAAGGWWFFGREMKPPVAYLSEAVARGEVVQSVSATGTLQAVNTVTVGSQVSGTISRVLVDYNSRVRKGQLLALIDPTMLAAEVAKSEADLASARADLASARADLANADRNRQRQERLYASHFVAKSDLDDARTSWLTAAAKVDASRAGVRQAEAVLRRGRANLGYTRIVSPIDGTVVGKSISEGQTVAASYQTPTLFTLAEDLTRMQVEADVDEADIGPIREGMPVTFTVDAFPDDTFRGRVSQVRLQAKTQENVVTYTVVVRVDNPDLTLKPGMTANVAIRVAEASGVLRVPAAALRFRPGNGNGEGKRRAASPAPGTGEEKRSSGPVVWVLQEGQERPLRRVPVEVGLTDGTWTAVSGDLTEGERVVTGADGTGSGKSSAGGPGRPFP